MKPDDWSSLKAVCPECKICPECKKEMHHGYHKLRSLAVASHLAVHNENLLRAENALSSTDRWMRIEGMRELRAVRENLSEQMERYIEVVWLCDCGHEEKVT